MPKKVRVPPGSRNPENDRYHLPRSQSSWSRVETRVSCPEARVRHEKDDSFRTVRCRHCQCIFYLCRRDDRVQCYCSAPCREAGRQESCRAASAERGWACGPRAEAEGVPAEKNRDGSGFAKTGPGPYGVHGRRPLSGVGRRGSRPEKEYTR